ncbi:MAG: membrane protein insertion efficiency factor YidD [Patescibacteria group bacterium]
MKHALIALIRLYKRSEPIRRQLAHNLHLPIHTCRFQPTCSEYTMEAIERYGAWKGMVLGSKRLLRCNPWSTGGHDPVP